MIKVSKTFEQKLKRPRAHKKMTTRVSLTSPAQNRRLNQLSYQDYSDTREKISALEQVTSLIALCCLLYFIITAFGLCFYYMLHELAVHSVVYSAVYSIGELSFWELVKGFYSLYYGVPIAISMVVTSGIAIYLGDQREKRIAQRRVI